MHEYTVRLFLFCMVLKFEISAYPTVLALFQFFFFLIYHHILLCTALKDNVFTRKLMLAQ